MENDLPWKCLGCGKILGFVLRNTSRISVLHVLAKPMTASEGMVAQVRGRMIAGVVLCDCGRMRQWNSGNGELRVTIGRN
jgi:hypothetical protein